MEYEFNNSKPHSRAFKFWQNFSGVLDRAPNLKIDLVDLGGSNPNPNPNLNNSSLLAAQKYVTAIEAAAANVEEGDDQGVSQGDLLLAHAYVRYLADLFGGSMLGRPTQLALSLPKLPAFYEFSEVVTRDRGAFIDSFYLQLNEADLRSAFSARRKEEIVEEAKSAFSINADIITERPRFNMGACIGTVNLVKGYLKEIVVPARFRSTTQ